MKKSNFGDMTRDEDLWNTIVKILKICTHSERRSLILFLAFSLCSTIVEVLSIGMVIPFLASLAVSTPEELPSTIIKVYNFFEFQSLDQLTYYMCFFLIVSFLAKSLCRFLMSKLSLRFLFNLKFNLGIRLARAYLFAPYEYYLDSDSSEMTKSMMANISNISSGIVQSAIILAVETIVASSIVILVLLVNPILAISNAIGFGVLVTGLLWVINKKIKKYGSTAETITYRLFRDVHQSFSLIKTVKVQRLEKSIYDNIELNSKKLNHVQEKNELLNDTPRIITEFIAILALCVSCIYLIYSGNSRLEILTVLSVYALSAYRLLPSINNIVRTASQIKYSSYSLNYVYNSLRQEIIQPTEILQDTTEYSQGFNDDLRLQDITFSYPNCKKRTLDNISLKIKKNQMVGFVGSSGSGKTTLVDLIMGLLKPTSGSILVDQIKITESNKKSWQKKIAYIPQNVQIFNDSILANITFGVHENDICLDKVNKVLEIARLKSFVEGLSDGIYFDVGEQGIKLSGGERQRLGIARALYGEPEVIILDEATSALDNITEEYISRALEELHSSITIMIVAHRLSTVKKCDNIFVIEKGTLVGEGTYSHLKDKNEFFRSFINARATQPTDYASTSH